MVLFNLILFLAVTLNGLLAGVFFTWTNAITPGIGMLDDIGYLSAFQSMNRTILNPLFYVVFFGSIVFSPIAAFIQFQSDVNIIFWLLLLVIIVYGVGVIFITFMGNIPLNEQLDKILLQKINSNNASKFRAHFEDRWNNLHFIRTVTSSASFLLLIVVLVLSNSY